MYWKSAIIACASTAIAQHALAQTQTRSHPADPSAATVAVPYASAFTGYRPLGEEGTASWRELNDEVARIGGHRGIVANPAPPANGGSHTHGSPDLAKAGISNGKHSPGGMAGHHHHGGMK